MNDIKLEDSDVKRRSKWE